MSDRRELFFRPTSLWIVLLFLVLACAVSPVGRKQLILVPDSQLSTLGAQAFEDLKRSVPVENDPQINRYIRCVALAVAKEAHPTPSRGWEVVVFKQEEPNAFALPGGKIGVHTGLLKVAKNQDQLAAVLGHEVGHVIARHGNERMSEALIVQAGLVVVSELMREKQRDPRYQIALAALGLGAQFGILLPHSRTQESEADLIGLKLMAEAGFDPRASVELWQNMRAHGGGQPPEFLSTHPSHGTRIENLNSEIPAYLPIFEKAHARGRRPNCG